MQLKLVERPRSYADYLRPKGFHPLRIERTVKREGDLVMTGSGFYRVGEVQ